MPQHGALSANGGHHWIIEGNTILRANTVGIDIGGRDSRPKDPLQLADSGGHIVRGNRIIGSGSGGIVGCANVEQSLIIGNLIEDTGRLGVEACWEAAAMKFHYARRMVIRDNVIRRVNRAPGIWIDYACRDNRISGNTIVDVLTVLAGVYVEASLGPNLIDGNIIWAMKDRLDNEPPKDGIEGGMGISSDVSDNCVIAHNLVGLVGKEGKNMTIGTHGIACHLAQGRRLSRDANNEHSAAACGGMAIAHNIVCNCFARVRLDRVNKNQCYGNIYPELIEGLHPRQLNEQAVRFVIKEHDRSAMYGLLAWQQFFDYDTETGLVKNANITRPTPDTLQLAGRELAAPLPGGPGLYPGAGPFNAEQLRVLAEGGTLTLNLTHPREGRKEETR
jgi:hypothetical protein